MGETSTLISGYLVKINSSTTFAAIGSYTILKLALNLQIIPPTMDADYYPRVSILIAARNEEANIALCLEAIVKQDYPAGKIDIWVGNDQSEDGTAAIIASFQQRYANIHSILIDTQWKHLRGKANIN